MKTSLTLTILCLTSLVHAQEFLTDISVTSGVRYNDNSTGTPENYEKFAYLGREEYMRYFTLTRNFSPFVAVQSSIIRGELKQQKKGRSLSLKLEGGFYFHRVNRSHHYSSFTIEYLNSDSVHYLLYPDDLSYTTRSNNLGLSLNVIFVKKWSQLFDFEYGLVFKSDFSFLQNISFESLPKDDSWRELEYSDHHYFKNRFNQQLNLYLAAMFNLDSQFSLGFSCEVSTVIYGFYATRRSYPIVGTNNNYINRNSFLGLKCSYTFKKHKY